MSTAGTTVSYRGYALQKAKREAQRRRLLDLDAAAWWAFKALIQARAAARVKTPLAAAYAASSGARAHLCAELAGESYPPTFRRRARWAWENACICEFDSTCGGQGARRCIGCGGDFCVCAACNGAGDDIGTECPGCPECPDPFDDVDDVDDDMLGDDGESLTGWTCRTCGCTDLECGQCIAKTGARCTWVEPNLCSACVPEASDE